MTQARAPMSIDNALTKIAARLGWAEMAHLVGKARGADVSERTVRDWGDPSTGRAIRIDDALTLDLAFIEAGGEAAPIHDTYGLLLDAARAARFASQLQLASATAVAIKEGGEACAALVFATLPQATAADRAYALRELEEAIAAMTRCAPLVQALLAREKPP